MANRCGAPGFPLVRNPPLLLPENTLKQTKQADWVSSIYKVSMPFFMRLSCNEIGLHAGMVPGYPASHCCIRIPKGDVQAFFKLLKIGDPVTIEP